MNWVLIALFGYFLSSIVALVDKFLLSEKLRPWQYVIYGGLWGIAALVLVPFGFSLPSAIATALAIGSGVVFLAALYPLYVLVNRTEITRANPLVGALVPIFTIVGASVILGEQLSKIEFLAFFLLVLGGLLIILQRSLFRHSAENVGLAAVAAILFAFSFVLIKASFNAGAGFLSGYVIARVGSFLVVLAAFLFFRQKLARSLAHGKSRPREQIAWVGASKLIAGISFLIINYAIFLGSVSLVQALQGIQYIFLLIIGGAAGVYIKSLREHFSLKVILVKGLAVILIALGLVLISLNQRPSTNPGEVSTWGITFSTVYSDRLGLNYQTVFREILDDLGVRHWRLIAYWPEIEPTRDQYNFERLDWLIREVERREGSIILVIGQKVPRFPECHIPEWIGENNELRRAELLEYLKIVMTRYQDRPVIRAWQVENEPFLPTTANLGRCPDFSAEFLDQEIALVKSLDPRPVIVTDSGELGRWLPAYKRADIFGTTLYRVVYIGRFGYFHHLSPPEFYFVKENLARLFSGPKPVLTIELQAEPWGPEQTYRLDLEERRKSMDLEQMRKNIEFAQRVGHSEAYFWGAEWWYWEKQQGYNEFWEEARRMFAN